MFERLFIRKANFARISSILEKERFSYATKDVEDLLKGNQKGMRYGNAVLLRDEGGIKQSRFIKIVLDGRWKTYILFRRQVRITGALHKDGNFTSPTMAVIRSLFTPPLPYAIFETREDGDSFGFMHDTPAFYEKFSEQEMRQLVEVIYTFHKSGFTIKKDTLRYTRPISSSLKHYERELKELLNISITHRSRDGQEVTQTVEALLETYMYLPNIRTKILQVLNKNFVYVNLSQVKTGSYLVHADMQIDNIYKHQNGGFELLDFEWVGRTDNPVIAIMYDYGNLRARAWSSPSFQTMLDKIMLEVGIALYPNAAMVQAALTLGILRSSLMMSRFHLDVINTVKKDRRTEEDYYTMYPKTIESLKQVLG